MTKHTPWMTLLAVLLIAGCGIGTEVGNGYKPGKNKKGTETANSDSHTSKAGTTPEVADSKGGGGKNTDTDADVEAPPFEPSFTFDIDLLMANCGSPFGEDLQSPIRLSVRNGDVETNILNAEDDGDSGIWALSDKDHTVLRHVTPSTATTDASVTATNASGSAIGNSLTCTDISRTSGVAVSGLNGTYTRVQTTVLKGSKANIVAWYLDGAAPYRIARVTVDDVDGEDDPTILEAD